MPELDEFFRRLESLGQSEWQQVAETFLGGGAAARRLAAMTQLELSVSIRRRFREADEAIKQAFDAAVKLAPGAVDPSWRKFRRLAGVAGDAFVALDDLNEWQREALFAPFDPLLNLSHGPNGRSLAAFVTALGNLDPARRDEVLEALGPGGEAAEAIADAIAANRLSDSANAAEGAARGASRAGGSWVPLDVAQGAAQAAARALLVRQTIRDDYFQAAYLPFQQVIPLESLGRGRRVAARTGGCILQVLLFASIASAVARKVSR